LRFGNDEAMLKCIELIAKRQGFGKLLAEGSARLAQRIGKGAEGFAMQVKGVDFGHHEPRMAAGLGLGYMINPHGADHCCNVIDDGYATDYGLAAIRPLGFLTTIPADEIGPRKVALFKFEHLKQVIIDCLLMCHLTVVSISFEKFAEITAAVTGWDTSATEQLRLAERVLTMARLFNIRQGLTAADDKLPLRFFQPKTDGPLAHHSLDPDKMEKAKKYYYTLMGWDENGIPLPEKVEELYIDEVTA